jgi:hypothetical protein
MKKFLVSIIFVLVTVFSFSQEYTDYIGKTKEEISTDDILKKAISVITNSDSIIASYSVESNIINVLFQIDEDKCNGIIISGTGDNSSVSDIYQFYLSSSTESKQLLCNNMLMYSCAVDKNNILYVIGYIPRKDMLIIMLPVMKQTTVQ